MAGNEALVEKTLEAIISSLDYFSCKYWNMLTDTEYPFNELALFKRIAFIRFMTSFTNYRPKNITLLQRISDELHKIVETSSPEASRSINERWRVVVSVQTSTVVT